MLDRDLVDAVVADVWLTSLPRTLLDCARLGTDSEQLLAALEVGRERGLPGRDDLARLTNTYPFAGKIR